VLEGHTNIAGTVAFGSDGENTVVVSGSRDHAVRIWYVHELAPAYFKNSTPN
jgi:WD40 repeat protein